MGIGFRCLLSFALGAVLTVSGCGPSAQRVDVVAVSCGAEDQRASYYPPVSGGTTVVIQPDTTFSAEWFAVLNSAAAKWNRIASEIGRKPFFAVDSVLKVDARIPGDAGSCDEIVGQEGVLTVIGVTDSGRWNSLGVTDASPGLTLRCHEGGRLAKQLLLIQRGALSPAEGELVLIHELGHALGLKHSCNDRGGDEAGYRGCAGLVGNHPYREAVMFPVLRSSMGSRTAGARELQANDKERTQCLYSI